MTETQIVLARELARCTFVPGIATKRFARDMAFRAASPDSKPLTGKQHMYLCTAVVRFRRQIPDDVVALAYKEIALANMKKKDEASASVR